MKVQCDLWTRRLFQCFIVSARNVITQRTKMFKLVLWFYSSRCIAILCRRSFVQVRESRRWEFIVRPSMKFRWSIERWSVRFKLWRCQWSMSLRCSADVKARRFVKSKRPFWTFKGTRLRKRCSLEIPFIWVKILVWICRILMVKVWNITFWIVNRWRFVSSSTIGIMLCEVSGLRSTYSIRRKSSLWSWRG